MPNTITAVKCRSCNTLREADGNYIIVKQATINYHSHPDKEVTKTNLREAVFCDTTCLSKLLQKDFNEDF